jgi:hypothetical protein
MSIAELRRTYHQTICANIMRIGKSTSGVAFPNFADGSNRSSVAIAWGIFNRLGCTTTDVLISGQTAGGHFETATKDFLEQAFGLIHHLKPGKWIYTTVQTDISRFDQYLHPAHVQRVIKQDREMASALGGNYIVRPDIVIARYPVTDDEINAYGSVVDPIDEVARLTPVRAVNQIPPFPILHASISCKWTVRSDRSQNTRTEALNLMRNRKGRVPHIIAVMAEPLPTRIATLALGTGDLDCVYHFALPELQAAIEELDNIDQPDMLNMLVEGRRLRDISDLPFDLMV